MSDFLETTVDKFTFRVATDRLYCPTGCGSSGSSPRAATASASASPTTCSSTAATSTFVTVKPVGTKLQVGDDLADFETIKVNIALASPVSGAIVAVNDALELHPELVNQSPYEKGWLAEIEATDWEAERAALLDAKAYFAVMKAQAEEEAKKL